MTLALFDLDNTLIAGDSDHEWGEFLVQKQQVDASIFRAKNDQFYADYLRGELDAAEYLKFALEPLSRIPHDQLLALREEFLEVVFPGLWLDKAKALVDQHLAKGHRPVVITATNRFVVEPIVAAYGIADLICAEPEVVAGRYTGKLTGIPCYQLGKVVKLNQWLHQNNESFDDAWFYSDSHNDLPLLTDVTHAVAVDPDEILRDTAKRQGWQIVSLR